MVVLISHCLMMSKPHNSFNLHETLNDESGAGPSSNSSILLREVAQQMMEEMTHNSKNRNEHVVAEGYTIE